MEDALAHLDIASKAHAEMTPDEKWTLITRNLQETLGGDAIKAVLNERDLSLYWGTATTGKPHIGYFVPMSKIADFLKAGCKVKVLLADLHAYLDNQKAPWDLLRLRTKYYEFIIKAMLESIGVPINQLEFIVGTTFQLSREYNLDAYRLAAIVTEHDAKKAGAEVVKQVDNALLSGLIYPGLQALDEEYLKVDTQFGGTDQRKIFIYAEKYLPQLGYKKRSHLMNYMVPGLMGSKMSSSDPDSKIDLLDDAKTIERKIKKAFCEEGNIQENGLLSFSKFVLFPLFSLRGQAGFSVVRKPEYGGNVVFSHYQELEDAFAKKDVHPGDLKKSMCFHLNELLEPIRAKFLADPELVKLTAEAYPSESKAAAPSKQPAAAKKPVVNNTNTAEDISRFKLVVGKIISVEKHPDADSLYVEKIEVGEEVPRTIVSGLVKYYTVEQLVGKNVVILANLKPSKLRGIMSEGMVLAGSNEAHTQVEVLEAPASAKPGQQVVVEGYENVADDIVNPKQKFYGEVFQALAVDAHSVATYKSVPLRIKGVDGNVTVASLKGVTIG